MVRIFRHGWDVVVAVTGGQPELGFIEGVVLTGKRRKRQTVRVRHEGLDPEVVRAVLESRKLPRPDGRRPALLGYRVGDIPTYYAKSDDLEIIGISEEAGSDL